MEAKGVRWKMLGWLLCWKLERRLGQKGSQNPSQWPSSWSSTHISDIWSPGIWPYITHIIRGPVLMRNSSFLDQVTHPIHPTVFPMYLPYYYLNLNDWLTLCQEAPELLNWLLTLKWIWASERREDYALWEEFETDVLLWAFFHSMTLVGTKYNNSSMKLCFKPRSWHYSKESPKERRQRDTSVKVGKRAKQAEECWEGWKRKLELKDLELILVHD